MGYISYNLSVYTRQGNVAFTEKISSFKIHLDRLIEISKSPILTRSYLNSLNRNLNIDTWSIFELCVTTLCDGISEQSELEKLLSHSYSDTIKCLNTSTMSENELAKLKKHLIKEHLTHVPIIRKTDFLFKKAPDYYGNIERDKEFLVFFGKLRNTLHTNYIYYGKNYEYKFGDAHFVFQNGKLVKWIDPFDPSPKLYFYLVGRLKEIWKTLITSIKNNKVIFYPDLDQE